MKVFERKLTTPETEFDYVIKNFKGKYEKMYATEGKITHIETDHLQLIAYLKSKNIPEKP